jgi:NAD(P)-dependent dehydrogenase (short-subunit alcohol dehydrogenase family)
MMEIAGRTFVITGGASGLGRATAELVSEAGGRPLLFDLDARVEDVAAEVGGGAQGVCGDVTSEKDVSGVIAMALDGGGLDVVVNCAGIGGGGRALRRDGPMPLEVFQRIITVNLIGTFNVNRLAAAAMSEKDASPDEERGVIINTASIAAYEGQIGQVSYASAKGGIVSMTLPLARELAGLRIRVVTIAPGIFDTPLLGRLSDEVRHGLAQSVPHPRRIGAPPEYAALVRHVVENEMLNGETIRLDGALRMAPR